MNLMFAHKNGIVNIGSNSTIFQPQRLLISPKLRFFSLHSSGLHSKRGIVKIKSLQSGPQPFCPSTLPLPSVRVLAQYFSFRLIGLWFKRLKRHLINYVGKRGVAKTRQAYGKYGFSAKTVRRRQKKTVAGNSVFNAFAKRLNGLQ